MSSKKKLFIIFAIVFVAVFACSFKGAAQAAPKQTHCKILTSTTTVQTRAVSRPSPGTYSGPYDQMGTQQREATTTTSRCRGKISSMTIYGAWA